MPKQSYINKIKNKKETHAQSAMEYLMTYGWAILIIAIALIALFELGYFNGSSIGLPSVCVGQVGFLCTSPQLNSTGNLTLTVGNNGNQNIVITGLGCSNSSSAPTIYSPILFTLNQNQETQLTFECQLTSQSIGTSFKGSLWLKSNSGQTEQVGAVSTLVSTSAPTGTSGSNGQGLLLIANNQGGNSGFGNIIEINANNGNVLSNIDINFQKPLFYYPQDIIPTSNGEYFYVMNQGTFVNGGSISVLNPSTNQVIYNITSQDFKSPISAAFSQNGDYAYITNYQGGNNNGNVLILDTQTNQVVNAISSSSFIYPEGIAITPNNQYVYVANNYGSNVLIISTATNQIVGSITSPYFIRPISIAVDPSGKNLYISNFNQNNVGNILIANISSNTVINSISSASIFNQGAIIFSNQNGYLMNGATSANVLVINPVTNQILYGIPVPYGDHYGLAVSGNNLYITNPLEGPYSIGNISIISLQSNTIIGNISQFNQPGSLSSLTSQSGIAYVVSGFLHNLYKINLLSGQVQPVISNSLYNLKGIDAYNQYLYGVNYNGGLYNSGNVVILNYQNSQFVGAIDSPSFDSPYGIAFSGSYAYVTNRQGGSYSTGNILVINTGTNQIVNSIQSQSIDYPSYLTTSGNSAYIFNSGSSNVLIVNLTTYRISGSIDSPSFSTVYGLTSSGKYIYAVQSSNVLVINTATNQVVNTLTSSNFDSSEGITII